MINQLKWLLVRSIETLLDKRAMSCSVTACVNLDGYKQVKIYQLDSFGVWVEEYDYPLCLYDFDVETLYTILRKLRRNKCREASDEYMD